MNQKNDPRAQGGLKGFNQQRKQKGMIYTERERERESSIGLTFGTLHELFCFLFPQFLVDFRQERVIALRFNRHFSLITFFFSFIIFLRLFLSNEPCRFFFILFDILFLIILLTKIVRRFNFTFFDDTTPRFFQPHPEISNQNHLTGAIYIFEESATIESMENILTPSKSFFLSS